jgi:hypothetical protein
MQRNLCPFLQPYDPEKYYPYPRLVKDSMEKNCTYRIVEKEGVVQRECSEVGRSPHPETLA